MTIQATIIAHSRHYGHNGPERVPDVVTFLLRYPRFIHAEVMTHRLFSRNASSSRAIPVSRLIEDVMRDPAMPIHWGKNQRGMQADEELSEGVIVGHMEMDGGDEDRYYDAPQDAWLAARNRAVEVAKGFDRAGYHKQVVNRIIEPFTHINVVVTATNYSNFFALRRHPDAQPEIKALADAMWVALQASTPVVLQPGEWHVPFVLDAERANAPTDDPIKASVARCARTSYMTHDGRTPEMSEDLALYDRLVGGVPLHASPAEHQASPDTMFYSGINTMMWAEEQRSGNFDPGWIQFRKTLDGERQDDYRG